MQNWWISLSRPFAAPFPALQVENRFQLARHQLEMYAATSRPVPCNALVRAARDYDQIDTVLWSVYLTRRRLFMLSTRTSDTQQAAR